MILPRKRVIGSRYFPGDPTRLYQLACVYVSFMSTIYLSSTFVTDLGLLCQGLRCVRQRAEDGVCLLGPFASITVELSPRKLETVSLRCSLTEQIEFRRPHIRSACIYRRLKLLAEKSPTLSKRKNVTIEHDEMAENERKRYFVGI